ncbi:MAG TPA: anti-sigma factor [Pyrinomonadaceae bacterium]|nr:anti-sigma factor [Pyrinomonadaceae bacterium]
MQHEDYKEMLALDATGALDAGERAALEEHLRSCAECRAESRELSDAAASLAYTVAPVAPPAALRSRILESVRALDSQPQVSAARRAAADGPNVVADGPNVIESAARADGPNARRATVEPVDWRGLLSRLSLWQIFKARPSLAFGAMAAGIAVVVLGFATFSLWNRTESLRGEMARVSERLSRSESELAGERAELTRTRDENDLLASPGSRVAQLAGKEVAPGARAVVAYDRASGRAVLIANGLPPAPAGKAYQLWLIADGKPLPGGTFNSDPEGRARMSDRLPTGADAKAAFAVTLEREGGESAPKGEMYLLSSAS